MAEAPENIAANISNRLREWIHDANNALFVTKGFLEEIQAEVDGHGYTSPSFDHENFEDMLRTVVRNVEKLDQSLQRLKKFAKEDVFDAAGVDRPQ